MTFSFNRKTTTRIVLTRATSPAASVVGQNIQTRFLLCLWNKPSGHSRDTSTRTALTVVVKILDKTLALESFRGARIDLSSRLRKVRSPPLTPISPIDCNDSVIARLVQHVVSVFSWNGERMKLCFEILSLGTDQYCCWTLSKWFPYSNCPVNNNTIYQWHLNNNDMHAVIIILVHDNDHSERKPKRTIRGCVTAERCWSNGIFADRYNRGTGRWSNKIRRKTKVDERERKQGNQVPLFSFQA